MLTKKYRQVAKRRTTHLAKEAGAVGDDVKDGESTQSQRVRLSLASLLADPATPAAARVNAARTLAELDGLIGRHQAAPTPDASAPLSTLSRDQLIAELEHLRTLVGLGLVR